MKNVALLSTSYSGSTLISMLACSHPNVIGFGDTYNYQFVNLDETSCTCGAKPSVSCPVRVDLERRMISKGSSFRWLSSNPTPIPGLLASNKYAATVFRKDRWLHLCRLVPASVRLRMFNDYYRQNLCFFESLDQLNNKTHYFDGCKSLLRVELLRAIFPDTKIVHLIKNPKAYLHSFLKREKRDYRAIVKGWVRYHADARDLGERLGPDSYRLVTFEELTRNPDQVVQSLYRFMGVPERLDAFDRWVDLGSVHVVGSRSKNVFRQVEEQQPKWRSELQAAQLDYIDRAVERIDWLQPILPRLDWV